jgi:hypothetical protein
MTPRKHRYGTTQKHGTSQQRRIPTLGNSRRFHHPRRAVRPRRLRSPNLGSAYPRRRLRPASATMASRRRGSDRA